MSSRVVFYRRRFLNRPRHHLGAHVIAEVDVERPDVERPDVERLDAGPAYVDARLHLSDCSRHITLDFSAYDRRDAENALRKVAVLRAVLDEFEEGLARGLTDAGLTRRS
jgi:hypothetical protein